jgi:NAD(P)H-hydrate epimerase
LSKPSAQVLILCGPGNNGGDGGVIARHLDACGLNVSVVWFADPEHLRGDAATQWTILAKSGIAQVAWKPQEGFDSARFAALLTGADWVVDALLGTGLVRPVEGILYAVIQAINTSGKSILALDLPSGLDADTGRPLGIAVQALATITFVSRKIGFDCTGASDYTGEVAVVDIGAPRCVLQPYVQP